MLKRKRTQDIFPDVGSTPWSRAKAPSGLFQSNRTFLYPDANFYATSAIRQTGQATGFPQRPVSQRALKDTLFLELLWFGTASSEAGFFSDLESSLFPRQIYVTDMEEILDDLF